MRARFVAVLAALFLAGCSTLNLQTAARLRTLDYARDDIASLLIAFDLPRGLAPIPGASTLGLDVVVAGQGERHIKAVLEPAEADMVAGELAPPGQGRAYYLFAFADLDRAKIREAQAWARAQPPGNAGSSVTVALAPRFCANGAADPAAIRISVLVALPGDTRLAPLIDNQRLADLLAQSGASPQLPACV